MKVITNFNNGIQRTPKEYVPLLNKQIPTQLSKPSPQTENTLRQLATPLAKAVQQEAQAKFSPSEIEKSARQFSISTPFWRRWKRMSIGQMMIVPTG
jgi:hypothetical protein